MNGFEFNTLLDFFGIYVLTVVTGFGGGCLRDIILGNHVPFLFRTPLCWGIALLATILVFIPFAHKRKLLPKLILLFDAVGLAFFTIVGIKAGLAKNLEPYQCILMGTLTACFGGVFRDVFVNQVPTIFYRDIYASLSLGGGVLFFVFEHFVSKPYLEFMMIGLIFVARILVLRWKMNLPSGSPSS